MTIASQAAVRFWLRPGGLATTTRGYSVFLKWQGGGLIGLSTKTLRSVAPSSTWAASYLHPFSAAFITTIAESSFQYTQGADLLRYLDRGLVRFGEKMEAFVLGRGARADHCRRGPVPRA